MLDNSFNIFNEILPSDSFLALFSPTDEAELAELINDVSNYDIYDFIARVSSLNLLIKNQNKSILFDALIAGILCRDISTYTSTAKMSTGRFKKSIEKLLTLSLSRTIDPPENTFIERVRYYGNFWIFPGINFSPSFCFQGFLDYLCLQDKTFNPFFKKEAHQLINFSLNLSDSIVKKLNYNENNIQHFETTEIDIPNSQSSELLKSCVMIKDALVDELLPSQKLQSLIFSNFTDKTLSSVLKENRQDFFTRPFIKSQEGSIILLNPSILIPFTIHQILLLAEKYGVKDELIDGYNHTIWNQCKKDIRRLGHHKVNEKEYGIELLNNSFFKEEILMVGNDKLLFLFFMCDPGLNYNESSMFDTIDLSSYIPSMNNRFNYFLSRLPNSSLQNSYSIVIINGFGRTVRASQKKREHEHTLTLSPFELHCISINEHTRPNFIPKYLNAKSQISTALPNFISSELNCLETYTQNGYSFYLSDEFNPQTGLLFFQLGDSLDYVIRAFSSENRHLINHYDNIHLADVTLIDSARNIYIETHPNNKAPELAIEFENLVIWICTKQPTTKDAAHISYTMIDLISYWLAECKTVINKLHFSTENICIKINFSDLTQEYFKPNDIVADFISSIKYELSANIITLTIDAAFFRHLSKGTNENEKTLISSLLAEISKFSSTPSSIFSIDEIFQNPLKKKVFEVNTVRTPYALPTIGDMQIISTEEEDQLLNQIGAYFLQKDEYGYGKVPDQKRAELANSVVSYLYSLLQSEVSSISPVGIFEQVCFDLETVMYRLMTAKMRFAYDISCYPEKAALIKSQYNEANKTSIALKFFAEYISSTPPTGKQPLGELQYSRILAICSLIIDWGYKNDSFIYNIVNTPIEFLPSGRIGMSRTENDFLTNINTAFQVNQLKNSSNPEISVYSSLKILEEFEEELNEAFTDEYGFSFDSFFKCIFSIFSYGESIKGDVKRVCRSTLLQEVSKLSEIDSETTSKIIDQITLKARENFLIPPKPFKAYDVYPWRFNRELSFTRRPIMQYENELIWGNRQLFHMHKYVLDLIIHGKYKARKEKLVQLIGMISNRRGKDFNIAIYKKLSNIPNLLVQKNITKINGKRIASPEGNTLGDIDILCIYPKRHKIIVGEVKDFSFAKNPYEMNQEYIKIFVDEKKPCFVTKHKRRVKWIEDHLDDVIKHFNLPKGKWCIRPAMFVSEEVVSNLFYHKNEVIVTYSEINEHVIDSI